MNPYTTTPLAALQWLGVLLAAGVVGWVLDWMWRVE